MLLTNKRKILANSKRKIFGIIIALSIGAMIIALFLAILNVANIIPLSAKSTHPDIIHLVRMGTIQALLSTGLSLMVGIMLAWALNRLEFFGRKIIIALFASAIVTPGIVIALGLIDVWGREGIISDFLQIFGIDWDFSIFGLFGILFAHTILNGAFAATILLARLDAIAAQKLKIAQSLALSPLRRFLLLDLPAIKNTIPALGAIIFLLAFTSFPIVLMLGGGPSNQTLEVAIYSAVRLSFDLKLAVQLSVVQLILCLLIIMPAIIFNQDHIRAGISSNHKWQENGFSKFMQITILVVGIFVFMLPIISILLNLFSMEFFTLVLRPSFWRATITSLTLGASSAILTLFIAIIISQAKIALHGKISKALIALPLYVYLIIPALVLSLGFYILARQLQISNSIIAPFVLILGNALLALPFAVAILAPSLEAINKRYNKLFGSLNLSSLSRWRFVEWPLLGREIGIVLALAFSFSLGDLGIISLFGTNEFTTLPWAMFQASGAYRNNDAGIIGAILLLIIFAVFLVLPVIFRKFSNVRS